MALATRRILVLTLLAASASSCGRGAPAAATVPASTAYSDGFEVVVFDVRDGTPADVRSVPLREAEQAIAAGATASVPGDPTAIRQKLSAGLSGDSRVAFTVTPLDGGRQQVRLAFHQGMRTYVYEYVVDGARITPVGSEYRDLKKRKAVRYAGG